MTTHQSPRIVVVGSSNTDMVMRLSRLPRPGENLLGGEFLQAAGGKGANQAVAAARLGAQVSFVARLGTDPLGDAALAGFLQEGIDTEYIVRDPASASGVALIWVVTGTGENTIVVAEGANAALSPADVQRSAPTLQGADIMLCQMEIPLPAVQATLTLAQSFQVRTILNPAPAQDLPNSLLRLVSVLTPNEAEAARLTGERDPERAAAALVGRGVPTVLVTLGAGGALLASADGVRHLPGFAVDHVADTTGAGDCFSGALAVALGGGQSVGDAARFAQAAAALCVMRRGAQPSLPTRAEVEHFLSH